MSEKQPNELVDIDVTTDFKYAYRGCDVHAYTAGQRYSVPKECANLAIKEKWAKKASTAAPQNASIPAATENAAIESAPENKGA